MTVRLRGAALAALLMAGAALPATAAPRAWAVRTTPHFHIHYYPGEERTAARVAVAAEACLPRLAADFGVTVTEPIPIVLSRDSFFNGSAEPLKNRIRLDPVLAASSEIGTERFVAHELSHVLTFLALQSDTPLSRLQNLGGIPTWFLEGIAQYEGEYWYHSNDEMLRLGTLQHGLLTNTQRDNFQLLGVEGGAAGYNEGYALTRYLLETHGKDKLKELMKLLRGGEAGSFAKAMETVFGKPLATLMADWQADMRTRYQAQVTGVAEQVASSSLVVPSREREVNVMPRLSPDGQRLAFLTSRHQDGYLYLRGHVMGGLTLAVADAQGERIEEVAVGRGRVASYAWSPDGKTVVLSLIDRDREGEAGFNLVAYDLEKRTSEPLIADGTATCPAWRPGTRELTYVETRDGVSRLMRYDLERKLATPWEVELGGRHARDLAWSPDGRTLALAVYATGGGARLATVAAGHRVLTVVTEPGEQVSDRAPSWSLDGQELVFASDRDGMTNLYRLALGAAPRLMQLTRVYTGASEPWCAPDGAVYYTASRAVGREIRRVTLSAGTEVVAARRPGALPVVPEPVLPASWASRPYLPTMTTDLVMPQITADERGSQLGVLAMYSDILEQQQLGLDVRFGLLSQRFSYAASYINRMNSTPWGVTLFDTPTVGITRQIDPARLNDAIYWQRSQGMSLGTQSTLANGMILSASLGLAHLGLLQGPVNGGGVRTGRQSTLSLGWADSHLARTADADLNPTDGYMLGAALTVSDRMLGSDFSYGQLSLGAARYFAVVRDWRHNLGWSFQYARNVGEAFPLFLGGIQGGGPLVPLRGYNVGSFAGDRLFVTALEYTFPVARGLDLLLGPLYLHQLYGAAFLEAGDAWTEGRPMQLHPTSGLELRLKTAFMTRQQVVFRVGVSRKLTGDGSWGMYMAF